MVKVQRLFAKTNLIIQVCRTDKIPLGTKGRTSILSYREYVRPAELHSRSAEETCMTENVSSLRSVKGATLPCDACASIPCGLAVREQQMKIQRQGFARSYRIRDAVRLVVHDDGRTIGGNQQEPALHANSAT